MQCFHCPKSCEIWCADDDKENRTSNMRRRVIWYNVTKTETMAIFAVRVIEWTNSICMLRIFNWILLTPWSRVLLEKLTVCS
jgi:hypothetical protein